MILEKFWSDEFEDVQLNDERISKRLISLLCSMSSNPGASIGKLCRDKASAKAVYRLMDNDSFEVEEVLSVHYEKTAERCRQYSLVILIQDTTGINYNHKSKKGMGRIGGKVGRCKVESSGLYCHNLLAFSPEGEPLGLFDQKVWPRTFKPNSKVRNALPIAKKESYKWLRSLEKDEFFENGDTRFVIISDRESDFGVYWGTTIDRGHDLIVRVRKSRTDLKSGLPIAELLSQKQESTEISVEVATRTLSDSHRRKPEKVHYKTAEQPTTFVLTYGEIEMEVESLNTDSSTVTLSAVRIIEKHPKKDTKPIEWIILTTLGVNNFAQAKQIIDLYKSRWRIEVFHKAQKSGGKIEKTGLRTKDRICRFILLQSLIAFGVCRIKYLLESHAEEPAENYFDKDHFEILYHAAGEKIKTKDRKLKVKEYIFMLANLEGYKTYKIDKPPGVVLLANAIKTFNSILIGIDIALRLKDVGKR